MKRKAAALAVGALFLAPAAHAQIVFGNPQAGTLQLYGKLYPQFQYGSSKDASGGGTAVSTMVAAGGTLAGTAPVATPGARRAIDTQNSYIGFRGERDITNHRLKFIWQIEQSVNFDTGDATWSNRNSFLGVRTGWGTVKLGNMDTIYKEYGDTFAMFGIASGNFVSASNMLSHIGLGNSNTARFHERRANSIQYETPTMGGLTAGFQYSPDEARETTGTGVGSAQFKDGSLYSYGVKWDSEKWYFSVHQERHNDAFGGSNNTVVGSNIGTVGAHSRDTGTRFSAEWRFIENQRVVFDIARLKYKESGQSAATVGAFEEYARTNWAIGWDAGFGGPWRLAVQYIKAQEGTCRQIGLNCTTEGLEGQTLNVGTRYRFDRQTFVYAIASKLWNGPAARFDNWAASSPARGADILQVALGLNYSF
jgi:predicted porin